METINKSSRNKALCALIPIPVICVLMPIIHINTWVWLITMTFSVVLYLSVMTFYCIKQKCYKQLFINYIMVITAVCVLYLQFVYVPKKAQNIERNQVEMKT